MKSMLQLLSSYLHRSFQRRIRLIAFEQDGGECCEESDLVREKPRRGNIARQTQKPRESALNGKRENEQRLWGTRPSEKRFSSEKVDVFSLETGFC